MYTLCVCVCVCVCVCIDRYINTHMFIHALPTWC